MKNPALLQKVDEEGLLTVDFCEVCYKPINIGEELCQTCRTEEMLRENEN